MEDARGGHLVIDPNMPLDKVGLQSSPSKYSESTQVLASFLVLLFHLKLLRLSTPKTYCLVQPRRPRTRVSACSGEQAIAF